MAKITGFKMTIKMKHIAVALACVTNIAIVASPSGANAQDQKAAKAQWTNVYSQSDRGGHIVGNPDAPTKVVEYASYTCGHCATFEVTDAPKIKDIEVESGKVSFEIRNLIRDGIDLTVAALARCAGKDNFFASHKYWMETQQDWLNGRTRITPDTDEKAQKNDILGYIAGVYKDMRLAAHAAKTGVSDAQAKACLTNGNILNPIMTMSNEGRQRYKIAGTPSFLINDKHIEQVFNYQTLKPFLIQK